MVVICSPVSVSRPWINFEAGAGWAQGIPVIPMCHSGLTPGQLPVPLSALQGGLVGNKADIQNLFARLAELADTDVPDADVQDFFRNIQKFEADTRANILLKDSQFIDNLLVHHVSSLAWCIYASTMDYKKLNAVNPITSDLQQHNFTFNDVYRLFDICFPLVFPRQKVYQVIQVVILRIADNIRFIISNSRLRIAPELENLLGSFLHTLAFVDMWAVPIALVDQQPPGENSLREQMCEMIKNEPLPPTRRFSNLINTFIDYYDTLVRYSEWVSEYRRVIARLTQAAPAVDT